MDTDSIHPETVRALRGSLSRAAFAQRLGVTPHTVYRWELPFGSKEARRPRGGELEKLEALRRGDALAGSEPPSRVEQAPSSAAPASQEALADVIGAIDRVLRSDWLAARAELLRLVSQARVVSPDVRALAATGLALVDLLLRSDPRTAIATLSRALEDASEDRLSPHVAAYVHACAACAHALPDATLFDIARVYGHAARAEALGRGQIPEISFLAWLGTMHVAIMAADEELLSRAFARLDQTPWSDLPPLLALHETEARAFRASFTGQRAIAAKLTEEVIAQSAAQGYGLVHARGLSFCALRRLDELDAPERILALARRSRQIALSSRASAGAHMLFAARAEVESLLRMGRVEDANQALEELVEFTRETGLPPIQAITTQARLLYVSGRYDVMTEVVKGLRACEVPSLRSICRASASYVEAMQLLGSSDEPERTVEAFERAAGEAKGWNFLLRDVLVFSSTAHVIGGNEASARVALRRAQRFLDRFPSTWASAHLRRAEGTLVALHGSWAQGRQLLEAAIGTFESGGDVADAALAKQVLAALAQVYEEPGARDRVEEGTARLSALGLRAPGALRAGVERILSARRERGGRCERGGDVERLVAPLQRLAVRGADPGLVVREMIQLASELVAHRPSRLEELDSNGKALLLGGAEDAPTESFEWVELGDGCGRRLRLGALGPLDEDARAALSILAVTGSLALEVATLRSAGTARVDGPVKEEEVEIPGVVAASGSMRALRSEIARLAGSRATVVIQGESGSGKEVIARAIHDLSTRARMPYVAFNCAAVPRDLFEGQLFGFRRGAFTGATRDQPGVLRAAEGGTIFLDEIGELPLDVQPKLLRFLENGEIFVLGDERPTLVDVRVIAATHRDLAALVRDGRFREDLYYRLQVVALRVAPLRDRRDDIAPLARHFLRQLSPGPTPVVLGPDALAKLVDHDWPGNVRELRNVIERALAYSPTPRVLRAEHLRIAS